MLTEPLPEPEHYRLAPLTFLTSAIRAELADLQKLCAGMPVRPLICEHLARVRLLLEQVERHATE